MRIKILSISLLLACSSVAVLAQSHEQDTVVKKSVTVTRDFNPVILEAGKNKTEPKVVEPVVNTAKPSYSTIATPLIKDYNIHTLPAVDLLHQAKEARKGFFRIGAGLPLNTLADFMYPIYNDENNRLDVALHHLGAFGDKKHARSSANIKYDHLFSGFDLYANVGGSHDYFNYYGVTYNEKEPFIMAEEATKYSDATYQMSNGNTLSFMNISGLPMENTHWRANGLVGVRSLPLTDGFTYDANLSYNIFRNRGFNVTEQFVKFDGVFEIPLNANKLGLAMDYYNFGYSNLKSDFPNNYNLFKLNPYFKIIGDEWFLKLGAKTGISTGGAGQIFSPSADVQASWNVIPIYLSLYGGVTGDLTVNSMSSTLRENIYLDGNTRITDTYTPIDAYAGLKFSPSYNLLFDVYGQYKVIGNQYFYVNKEFNRLESSTGMPADFSRLYYNIFEVVYSSATRASAGFRASWDYKNQVNLYLKGAYHKWNIKDEAKAWHLPTWDVDFGANVNLNSDLSLNTQFIFQDGRFAKLASPEGDAMKAVVDWNIGASYAYREWISVFAKVNNLLNKKYGFYQGYDVMGINGILGVSLSF